MTEDNTKLTKTYFIIGTVVLVIILFFVFSNKPTVEQAPHLQEANKTPQEVAKQEVKTSGESTTTTAVDVNSTYLKEEMARKRQRDADRKKCIADAEREYAEFESSTSSISAFARAKFQPNLKENIDRCYFRFPNN